MKNTKLTIVAALVAGMSQLCQGLTHSAFLDKFISSKETKVEVEVDGQTIQHQANVLEFSGCFKNTTDKTTILTRKRAI